MKTLSLLQPWASLIAIGAKRIETRSWRTPYRGPLAIHASKSFPSYVYDLCLTQPYLGALMHGYFDGKLTEKNFRDLRIIMHEACGKILCIVDLIDYVPTEDVKCSKLERDFGDYTPGRYGWILDNPKKLETPLPARGRLGLWEWDQAVLA